MPNTEETEQPSTLQSTLIGNLILADELCFAQDEKEETADGYLIATDALVQRLLKIVEKRHTLDELHTLENLNFFPVYNLASGDVEMECTYWFTRDEKELHGSTSMPLTFAEREELTRLMDAYSMKQDGRNCLSMLNGFRAEDDLPPLSPLSENDRILAAVTKAASAARAAMEKCYGEDLAGKCIESSEKVVEYLSSQLGLDAVTVEGWCQFDDECYGSDRPWDPHTWAEIPSLNLYIDITADQFNYGMARENEFPPVLVCSGLPHGMRYDEPTWAEYPGEGYEVDDSMGDEETNSLADIIKAAETKMCGRGHGDVKEAGYPDHLL